MKRLLLLAVLLLAPSLVAAQQLQSIIIQPLATRSTDYKVQGGTRLDAPLSKNLRGIRVVCTTVCYIDVATTSAPSRPEASVATGIYIPAGVPFFMLTPGDRQVDVTTSNNGTISITEF